MLRPPNIQGTLPSFYENDEGAVILTVPFAMNKSVGLADFSSFSMKIKTSATDVLLGTFSSSDWNPESKVLEVKFDISTIESKLVIGQYYRVQIAYKNTGGEVGYYSTIGVAKYTAKPAISIVDFMQSSVNLNKGEYIGRYWNTKDTSERVYQYKFTLYNAANEVLETSGWLLHNSYMDETAGESFDTYVLKRTLDEGAIYRIQYSVITNNNLSLNSVRYQVMAAPSVDSFLKAKLNSILDYDNACITTTIIPDKNADIVGTFVLSRATDKDSYTTWTTLAEMVLKNDTVLNFKYVDFAIEQGVNYRYSLQQRNSAGIFSNRIYSQTLLAHFEDAFLFDGERQLKIRFNPKVSSFKTVMLDSKKTTLGSKYPFFFRNGAVAYKEFPISGLISYMIDNDEYFMKRQDDLGMSVEWMDTTDITDQNITYERRFKLEVLDWLNNGGIKMYKSPAEGNYVVRLMNVSLTPNDSLSRMIHTFNCTASEVAEYDETIFNSAVANANTLIDNSQIQYGSIVLSDFVESVIQQNKGNIGAGLDAVANIDLLDGQTCYHLKITEAAPGTIFMIGSTSFMIGMTGAYEVKFDEPVRGLYISSPGRFMSGTLTYGYKGIVKDNSMNIVSEISVFDVSMYYKEGPNTDVLIDYNDSKYSVSRIHYARFSPKDIEVFETYNSMYQTYLVNVDADRHNPYFNEYTIYQVMYDAGDVNENKTPYLIEKYYRYVEPTAKNGYIPFEEITDYSTQVQYGDVNLDVKYGEIIVPPTSTPPKVISIGAGVKAEFAFQVKIISYETEVGYANDFKAMLAAYETYRAYCLNWRLADEAEILDLDTDCYIFQSYSFVGADDGNRQYYVDNKIKVWVPCSDEDAQTIELVADQKNTYIELKDKYLQMVAPAQEEA